MRSKALASKPSARLLLLAGVLAGACAWGLALLVPIVTYANDTTLQGQFFRTHKSQFAPLYALLSAQGEMRGLLLLLAGCVLYTVLAGLYWKLFLPMQQQQTTVAWLWQSRLHWLLLALTWAGWLAAYPLLSDDASDYLVQARLVVHYGVNPYLPSAQELLVNDAWQQTMSSSAHRSALTYGPSWLYLSLPVVALAGSSLPLAFIALKLLNVVLVLVCGAAIWRLLADEAPYQRRLFLLLLAWHPLLWLEVLWNGHNDVAMMVWVVLALLALQHNRPLLTAGLLMGGVATKYIPLLLVPLFLVALLRKKPLSTGQAWRLLAWFALTSAIVLALLYAPVLWDEGLVVFTGLTAHAAKINPSFGAFLQLAATSLIGNTAGRLLLPLLLLGMVGWQGWRVWQGGSLPSALLVVLLVYVLLLSPWLVPWYGIWLLVLAPLSRSWMRFAVPAALLVLPAYYLLNALPFPDWLRVVCIAGIPWLMLGYARFSST
jgi:hypothetical protein